MSVEDEKKPRKSAPKKKVGAASTVEAPAPKKVKAAAPKAAPKKKTAKISRETPVAEANGTPLPTHAQIAERAHSYFVARGGQHGFHVEDWLRAEHELMSGL